MKTRRVGAPGRALAVLALATATCLAPPVGGVSVSVGGTQLEIPPPDGFVALTPELRTVYEFQKQFIWPNNEQLAVFIAESDIPIALRGEIPPLTRVFRVQVARSTAPLSISHSQFEELKEVGRKQVEDGLAKLKKELPLLFDKVSEGVSASLGAEIQIALGSVVPLPAHEDSDHAFAWSTFVNTNFRAELDPDATTVTSVMTSAFVHVKGKVLFLYCYGAADDLEWTRTASHAWSERILKLNETSTLSGLAVILLKGLIAALLVFGGAALYWLLDRQRKRIGLAAQELSEHDPAPVLETGEAGDPQLNFGRLSSSLAHERWSRAAKDQNKTDESKEDSSSEGASMGDEALVWYYAYDGKRSGPIPEGALRRILETSSNPRDTLVWREGMTDWARAGEVEELGLIEAVHMNRAEPSSELAKVLPPLTEPAGPQAAGSPSPSGAALQVVITLCILQGILVGVILNSAAGGKPNVLPAIMNFFIARWWITNKSDRAALAAGPRVTALKVWAVVFAAQFALGTILGALLARAAR